MQQMLTREEKLKSRKLIDRLFAEGKSVSVHPIKLIYLKADHQANFPLQVGFSIPKRTVKKAVHRNRIKRLLRECYRKHKHLVYDKIDEKYVIMLLYLDENEQKYVVLEGKMIDLLQKFIRKAKYNAGPEVE